MIIKKYNFLPDEARYVREKVFVEEQGFKEEFDSVDERSIHLVMFDNDAPVAVCRVFRDDKSDAYLLGRLCVMKAYRGQNFGKEMVEYAEQVVRENNADCIILHAQCAVRSFYNKMGYSQFGNIDYDESCPHIWMKKNL